MSESPSERRRRLINLGELIALAALIVSAVGVWIAWKSSNEDKPTRVVEQHQSVPLTLRATANSDGSALLIVPVNRARRSSRLPSQSKRRRRSSSAATASCRRATCRRRSRSPKEPKDGTQKCSVRIDTHYVEMGADRRGGGAYVLRYRWEGGGLFGGRSVRLLGLSR